MYKKILAGALALGMLVSTQTAFAVEGSEENLKYNPDPYKQNVYSGGKNNPYVTTDGKYNPYTYNQNYYGYPKDVANTEYFAPVKFLKDRLIISGNESGLFMPQKTLTRAELAVMVAKATGNDKNILWDEKAKYFDDLAGYDWAMPYINACRRLNILRGKTEKLYDPGAEVSYVEYMAVIARMQNPYVTVSGSWPQNYINYSKTILGNVVSDRNIQDWSQPINRGDMAMIMYRILPKN